MCAYLFAAGFAMGLIFSPVTAAAWTGPTGSAPNNNVAAPLNVGTLSQVKNGNVGVNGLAVYGNTLLDWQVNGGGTVTYLNFSDLSSPLTQSSGYGIRDNAGTLEFKNSGGSWQSLQAVVAGLGGGTITGVTAGTNMTGGGTSGTVTLSTSLTPTFNDIYANNWFRVNGSGGIYWQTYGGGWYMSDSYWMRTYSNNGIWAGNGNIGTNGSLTVGYNGAGASAGGAIFSGDVSIGTTNVINLLTVNGNIADEGQANCSGTNALQTNSNGTIYCGSMGSTLPYPVSSGQTWNWSGQGGQPSWLWGSNDGNNFYVWNPSNFNVNYANSAGNANTVDGYSFNQWLTVDSSPQFNRVLASEGLPGCPTSAGFSFYQDGCNDTGMFSNGDGDLRFYSNQNDAMNVEGNTVYVNGPITASAFYYNSDERLKHNIASIATSTALSDVLALRPVTFNWNNVSLGTTTQIGFIAQEVQGVVPQIVQTNASTTMESVDYARVTPLLVGSVQALDQTIEDQQRQIDSQQGQMDSQQGQITAQQNTIASEQKEIDNLMVEIQALQHK